MPLGKGTFLGYAVIESWTEHISPKIPTAPVCSFTLVMPSGSWLRSLFFACFVPHLSVSVCDGQKSTRFMGEQWLPTTPAVGKS